LFRPAPIRQQRLKALSHRARNANALRAAADVTSNWQTRVVSWKTRTFRMRAMLPTGASPASRLRSQILYN